jgi:hypothetical protein
VTKHVISEPRDGVSGLAPRRSRWSLIAAAIVILLILAGTSLWILGRLPGTPMRAGPLEGTDFEELRAPTKQTYTGLLWGSLLLHNSTDTDIILEKAYIAGNPQQVTPTASPYIWDETRVELLNTGAISGHELPLPSTWKLPTRHPLNGYRIPPQNEETSIEVLFELPIPDRTTILKGITIEYQTGGIRFRKTFDVNLTICAPADPAPCNRL